MITGNHRSGVSSNQWYCTFCNIAHLGGIVHPTVHPELLRCASPAWVYTPAKVRDLGCLQCVLSVSHPPNIATPQHDFSIDHFKPCSPVAIPIRLFEWIEHAFSVLDFLTWEGSHWEGCCPAQIATHWTELKFGFRDSNRFHLHCIASTRIIFPRSQSFLSAISTTSVSWGARIAIFWQPLGWGCPWGCNSKQVT